jgi:hypothetical protein
LKGIGYDSTEKWEQGMMEAIERHKPETGSTTANKSSAR